MTHTDVEDLAAVWQLQADYARHVDGRDAAAWSRLFSQNGTLAVGTKEITGRDALEAFGAGSSAGVHLQGVPSVERGADGRIRAISSFMFVNAETHAVLAGEYRDDIEQTDEGLVFARRQIEMRVRG